MAEPEWLETARKNGLNITSRGINMGALAGSSGARSSTDFALTAFLALCHSATNESLFQDRVVDLAHSFDWKVVHIRRVLVKMGDKTHYETPFDIDGAGSFDLDFYRERHFKAELKFGKNVPQPNQREWKDSYDRAGVENYIWYPKDAKSIFEVLKCHRPGKG